MKTQKEIEDKIKIYRENLALAKKQRLTGSINYIISALENLMWVIDKNE